jgi:molybdate transport system substrate-binding protein
VTGRFIAKAIAICCAVLTSLSISAVRAADVKILCASGMREVVSELKPQIERATGQRVDVSFGEAGDLRKRIKGSEPVDVVVLPRVVLDQLLSDGKIVDGSTINLAQSSMGIGVRADAPKPDIGSTDGLKRFLLAAKSIAVTDPASGGVAGVYIANVFQRLGIAEELQPKLKLTRGQRNAEFVAKGEVEVAIQLSNEIRIVPGIEFIPLPREVARTFVFSAALASDSKEIESAKTVLQFLSGSEAVTVIRGKGMDEAAPK